MAIETITTTTRRTLAEFPIRGIDGVCARILAVEFSAGDDAVGFAAIEVDATGNDVRWAIFGTGQEAVATANDWAGWA